MALADWGLPGLARETTSPVGTTGASNHYNLLGAAPGHKRIALSLADQGESQFVVKLIDPTGTLAPVYEFFRGRYHSSTDTVEPLVRKETSSGVSAINWSSGTTCDIYIDLFGQPLKDLTNPYLPSGLITRTSEDHF